MVMIDVVDDGDKAISKAQLEDVHNDKLRHRIVHVLIFNSQKDILLKLNKENLWNMPIREHVYTGEDYEQAALRNVQEKYSINCDMDFFSKELYITQDNSEAERFIEIYKGTYDEKIRIKDDTVEKVEFFNFEKIQDMINKGDKFDSECLVILKKYFKIEY